jgi:soluble lytic murein transglycosylase-like protein
MAYSVPIDGATREKVYQIGLLNGIPVSVTRQLMYEESRGYANAVSHMTDEGFYSRGLFQLYDKPGNIEWLLAKFWTGKKADFDIYDPIDNATVALAYLSWLHNRYGNWTHALWFYNHGRITGVSDETKAYAKRIINAK